MAKKPGTNPKGEFVFFDVVYEDGSQRSNRRVPAELLGGLEKDAPALGFIIEQDREIAEKSGRAPLKIKTHRPRRGQAGKNDEDRLAPVLYPSPDRGGSIARSAIGVGLALLRPHPPPGSLRSPPSPASGGG